MQAVPLVFLQYLNLMKLIPGDWHLRWEKNSFNQKGFYQTKDFVQRQEKIWRMFLTEGSDGPRLYLFIGNLAAGANSSFMLQIRKCASWNSHKTGPSHRKPSLFGWERKKVNMLSYHLHKTSRQVPTRIWQPVRFHANRMSMICRNLILKVKENDTKLQASSMFSFDVTLICRPVISGP